jgi:hypothetical protein
MGAIWPVGKETGMTTSPNIDSTDIPHDILWGAGAIAKELYGVDDRKTRRRAFYLLETEKIPANKVGVTWVASRKALRAALVGEAA